MTHVEAEVAYPRLYRFLACYFHEDWYDQVTLPEERLVGGPEPEPDVFRRAVRAYATDAGAEAAMTLVELDRLLASSLSDLDLGKLLSDGFHIRYWPGSHAAYRQWLREVRTTLAASLASAA